jgi:tRNA nucleotidyltransferase/poly(A) polymerase
MVGEDKDSYAGRWVALLHGRVVAQGGTPEQTRRAAQSRFKETPEIVFMPTKYPLTFSPLLDSVRDVLPDGLTVYLVGGAVRDALLGRRTHDLDFALSGDAIKTARGVANALKADFYPLDTERDTGRIIVTSDDGTRTVLDFAAFRGPDLESDLTGRDFTVNAIAMDLRSRALYDPLGGAMDLKDKRLRACSQSAFMDDPVRILRGVRLAADFGFHILPETRKAMKEAVGRLGKISPERLRDELFRILEGPQPATCIRALEVLGALDAVLPELSTLKGVEQPAPHVHDVWAHTLAGMQYLESTLAALAPEYNPETASDLFNGLLVGRLGRYRQQFGEHFTRPLNVNRSLRGLLFLAALYHDIAKPRTKQADDKGQLRFWDHDQQGAEIAAARARSLALSNDEIVRLETIVRNHVRVLFHTNRLAAEQKQPTRRAVYRFFRDAGPAGVDIILLALADMRATYEHTLPQETWTACLDVCRLLLENWWEKPGESVTPPPLLNGDELMLALKLRPGPKVGELLEAIREAQATGKVNAREDALVLARDFLAKGIEQK